MESILCKIINDCGSKHQALKLVAQSAYDVLISQQGNPTLSMHVLREECLSAIEMALDSGHGRLVQHALEALQFMLRDNQLHSLEGESEAYEQRLPVQILHTLANLPSLHYDSDAQCHCFTIILQLVASNSWQITSKLVSQIIELSISTVVATNQLSVRMAARATVSQIVSSYCSSLYKEQAEDAADGDFDLVFAEISLLELYLADKLEIISKSPENSPPLLLVLDSILALLSSQPASVNRCTIFTDLIWQKISPCLIALLGNETGGFHSTDGADDLTQHDLTLGRGACSVEGEQMIFGAPEIAGDIYSICIELLRILGPLRSMRSVLDSLFHRIFIFPPPSKRLPALRALKKLLMVPERIVDLLLPSEKSASAETKHIFELSTWKIILDSLVGCNSTSRLDLCVATIECIRALIASLDSICNDDNEILSSAAIQTINSDFQTLANASTSAFEYASSKGQRPFLPSTDNAEWDSSFSSLLPKPVGMAIQPRCQSLQLLSSHSSVNHSNSNSAAPISQSESVSSEVDEMPFEGEVLEGGVSESEKVDDYIAKVSERISSALKRYGAAATSGRDNGDETISEATKVEVSLENDENRFSAAEERSSAEQFLAELRRCLPGWKQMKSCIELDEVIQAFASEFAKEFSKSQLLAAHSRSLNGNAVYLTVYASLSLCRRLRKAGFYNGGITSPISKRQFQSMILNTACLSVASEAWVLNVYDQILSTDLVNSDEDPGSQICCLIEDFDGSTGQILSDVLKLEKASNNRAKSARTLAGCKLCRWLVTASWVAFLDLLSSLMDSVQEKRPLHSLAMVISKSAARQEQALLSQGISASLEGLQQLALLCTTLELQSRCGCIFGKLVDVSCPLAELRTRPFTKSQSSQSILKRLGEGAGGGSKGSANAPQLTFQIPHVLSMQIVLNSAIEVGSCAPDCWKHVIRCCEYISELEHMIFARERNGVPGKTKLDGKTKKGSIHLNQQPEETGPDFLMHLVSSPLRPNEDIADILKGSEKNVTLDTYKSAKILCVLSAKVDKIFENAALCLNLSALISFVEALICASQTSVFYSIVPGRLEQWTMLQRISDLVLRQSKSRRPLVHLMKLWACVSPHFIEASCSKLAVVQSKSVSFLHDCVLALLSVQPELDTFQFNESLLLPIQTIVCLELCHPETQNQLVCVLAEFVESLSAEMRSGWRPLFMTLKALRVSKSEISKEQFEHLRTTIADVFNAFLHPSNLRIFCLAAFDCVKVLLKFLRKEEDNTETASLESEEDEDISGTGFSENDSFADLALENLIRVHQMLISLFTMEDNDSIVCLLPRVNCEERWKNVVDPTLPLRIEKNLPSLAVELSYSNFFEMDFCGVFLEEDLHDWSDVVHCPWQQQQNLSNQLILQLWFHLVEGLAGGVVVCHRPLQPRVIQALCNIIECMKTVPGADFGLFCLNHLVLPMLQSWLRREASITTAWRENKPSVRNFKQCVGLVTELVVDYVLLQPDSRKSQFLLKQTLDFQTECIAQPSEIVSRLGCSSLKHLINSVGSAVSRPYWDIICKCLWKCTTATLLPVRILMCYFQKGSNSYYGDYGQVQVALRKDTNPKEASRMRILAQQVFLLDSQKYSENLEENPDNISQSHRSVVFLLQECNPGCRQQPQPDSTLVRLPFRDIVVSLLSHQLLLQLIGNILLQGTGFVVSGASSLLVRQVMSPPSTSPAATSTTATKLPGRLGQLSSEQVLSLLLCLDASFHVAYEFDQRRGLKFLLQRVFNSTVAANLYKQAVTAWTFRLTTLFEISANDASLVPARASAVADLERSKLELVLQPEKTFLENSSFTLRQLSKAYAKLCQGFVELQHNNNADADPGSGPGREPLVFLLSAGFPDEEPGLFRPKPLLAKAMTQSGNNSVDLEQPSSIVGGIQAYQNPCQQGNGQDSSTMSTTMPEHQLQNQLSKASFCHVDGSSERSTPVRRSIDANASTTSMASTSSLTDACNPGGSVVAENVEENVYSVVTSDKLSEYISGYRKQKAKSTMPPSGTPSERRNPFDSNRILSASDSRRNSGPNSSAKAASCGRTGRSVDSVENEEDVEREEEQSIVKDGEACAEAWSEMVTGLLRLMLLLRPNQFRSLLPAIFSSYSLLISSANQKSVRRALGDFMCRIGEVYNFNEDPEDLAERTNEK